MVTESDVRQFIAVVSALADNRAIHQELAEKAIRAVARQNEMVLLTRREAANMLKCSVKTIDRLCDEGKLPRIRYSRRSVRIRLSDLKAMSGL
ncbi:helix-turn-helix domain-containing protein [uncultured Victivallis sp.]|uniref:helix-turn-helix transcriptional regulator n=1 Tax=uncultured Victivallis sp. TaxID=354118 RepID=UPI00338DA58C